MPALINRWSEARVAAAAPARDADPPAAGSRRRVRVRALGVTVALDEVIEASVPGVRLAYRVIGGPAVRSHRAVISLEPSGAGTRLAWEVEIATRPAFLARVFEAVVRPQLERSLDALAALL